MSERKPFWVSWYGRALGPWEWHGPWWISGEEDGEDGANPIFCAAVLARDEDDAKARILAAHDAPPGDVEWRFVNEHDADWSPFGSRFRQAKWMRWPHGEGRTGAIES